ncbi:MAG: roadblock/LC7 domain-containing protein [Candidatus Thorarchaeota archaeon]
MSKRMAKLDAILRELEQNCDLIGSALVSDKGQMISSSLPESAGEKAVSAMAAAILSIGNRVGVELNVGTLRSTRIDGEEKSVMLKDIGRMLLVGIAPSDSEIGLIDFELSRTVERVERAFGNWESSIIND